MRVLIWGFKMHNRLLLALPGPVLRRLQEHLEEVVLGPGAVIGLPDHAVEHLYFVERGFISLVKTMEDGRSIEVGGIGLEGMTDPHSLFSRERPVLEAVVQIRGQALRVRREVLKAEVDQGEQVRELFTNYSRFLLAQIARTAACNRLHTVEQRACRWLLIANDNALSDSFVLTHEFLAMMLGVRRASVSQALQALQRAAVIDYQRGFMRVLRRSGLEEKVCECYRAARNEIETLFAPRCDPAPRRT